MSWFSEWFGKFMADWFGAGDEDEQQVVGGGLVDGAMDKAAMDAAIRKKRRKRALNVAMWAYGSRAL